MTSAVVPTRYGAFGGAGIEYDVTLEQGGADVAGDMFDVNDMTLEFSGHPNVLSGDYLYVLKASSGMGDAAQEQSRKWKLTVTDRTLGGIDTNTGDQRENTALYGEAATVADAALDPDEDDATIGDFGGRVPDDFEVALDNIADALVTNVPRLRVGVVDTETPPMPVGLWLNGEIHSNVDVDAFWLGALSPNWMLELKVIGTGTVEGDTGIGDHNEVTLELYQMGSDMPVELMEADDPSYDYQVGGSMGGLTCGDYYLLVSGEEGLYTLAWKVSHQATASDGT